MVILIAGVTSAIVVASAILFSRRRTIGSAIQLAGAGLLVVMVLTHVAEAFHLWPAMGWGQPQSGGHYLDLASAVLGLSLCAVGYIFGKLPRHRN
jgi:hypothetical protein